MSATAPSAPKLIFGSNPFFEGDVAVIKQWLETLREFGIKTIDTAQFYGESEAGLGQAHAAADFTIDTKLSCMAMGEPASKANVIKYGRESLKKLQTDSVDVYYLHLPDRSVPFEDTMSGLQELYEAGAFKRLGLSNFLAHEVDEIVAVAEKHGWVKPSVYQGNYNAVARGAEAELLPTLRRHGMSFYAYSPSAGGFLTKTPDGLVGARWDTSGQLGKLYSSLYKRPSLLEALKTWGELAAEEGASRGELAYRWNMHNSALSPAHGDGLIVGARTTDQLKEVLGWIAKGPLSPAVVDKINVLWEGIKDDAPLDNLNSTTQGWALK
ncbi:hypothetical protein PpBr36_07937 [Pyricularia pennisetigena]|uniref:hypothetical protein n=1 Tax=Pyricularia pennisetigena TaxID=1578925 RepID=UPI001150EB31|nr:hypothetical protein PpBr36_07937 [Pyricularia pennisetigena]TLS25154.1 hypothetical protein PpBr36_07937 [Pyricularia pennisetigena]